MQDKTATQDDIVQGILQAVRAHIASGGTGLEYDSAFDQYRVETIGFFRSINWTEPFLINLMILHVVHFAVTMLGRNNTNVLTFQVVLMLFSAWLAEPINTFCRDHWEYFADVNYFDENGFFISMVYAFPLLLNATLGLVFILRIIVNMIIDLKRKQIRDTAKKNQKKSKRE